MRANKGGKLIQGGSSSHLFSAMLHSWHFIDDCVFVSVAINQSIVPGQDLQKQLEKEFKFVPVIKYKDPEGDKVSMKKQGDFEVPPPNFERPLAEGVRAYRNACTQYALSLINGNALRLYIAKKHKRVK